MQSFVRMTSLKDIGGRANYISNPERQEHIVTQSAPVDWKPYIDFEASSPKTAKRNNEGREVIMALPNEWDKLPEAELQKRAGELAKAIVGDRDHQWAVHWNKAHTNLHIHIIFSERQREKNPGVWDRDIYHTADGKVARKKADRAKGADGKDLPPVHRKGTPKQPFTAKDKKFTTKKWLHEIKQDLRDLMVSRWGVQIDALNVLHEYHEGNGDEAPIIRAKNEVIRANIAQYKAITADHPEIPDKTLRKAVKAAAMAQEVLHLTEHRDAPALVTTPLNTHQRIMEIKQTISEFSQGAEQSQLIEQQIARSGLNFAKRSKLKKKWDEQRDRNVELRQKLDRWSLAEFGSMSDTLAPIEWFVNLAEKLIKAILLPPEKIKKLDAIIDQRKEQKREKHKSIDDQILQATRARPAPAQKEISKVKKRSEKDISD